MSNTKHLKVSNNVIRRLPRYVRKLDDLAAVGVTRISSSELGHQLGLTPSQIRQDFSCFGEFGQQGYGYNVKELRDQISVILGADRGYNAILIGVGNIGHALMDNFCFSAWGVNLISAFDIDESLIGKEFNGILVRSMDELSAFVQENEVDLAVLTVPRSVANATASKLLENGITAIWNFTNVDLNLPEQDVIVENVHFSDSLLSLSYYITERSDEEAERAARLERQRSSQN